MEEKIIMKKLLNCFALCIVFASIGCVVDADSSDDSTDVTVGEGPTIEPQKMEACGGYCGPKGCTCYSCTLGCMDACIEGGCADKQGN